MLDLFLCAELRSNRNSREVSELLTHYSRQIMGEITTVVFERLQQLQPGSPAADEAAAMSGVLPHISSVVAAAAAEAAAVKAAHAAEAAAAQAAVLEREAAAAEAKAVAMTAGLAREEETDSASEPNTAADADATEQPQQLQQQYSVSAAVQAAQVEPRSPGAAAAVAAAAAAAAAAASTSAGGAPGTAASNRQLSETVGITGHQHKAAGDGASDADATQNSSSVVPTDLTSLAGSAAMSTLGDGSVGSYRHSGVGASSYSDLHPDDVPPPALTTSPHGVGSAELASSPQTALPPLRTSRARLYSHGLPCAVEVLSFLIDCVAQRRLDADGASAGVVSGTSGAAADDEYAMFGLAMVHRALLAGGSSLQCHEALLGLLHRELFAAMTVAVSNCGTAAPPMAVSLVFLCSSESVCGARIAGDLRASTAHTHVLHIRLPVISVVG